MLGEAIDVNEIFEAWQKFFGDQNYDVLGELERY